jgi:class 3 adenylate cyclase
MENTKISDVYLNIIDNEIENYSKRKTIQVVNTIPETQDIPINNPLHWLRIPEIICVFVDMIGSTKLSAVNHDVSTAGVYQLFTGTAVRLFHEFESPYIDVRGDGVFALFNRNQKYRALASTITFKTFVEDYFTNTVKNKTGLNIGSHIGIDQKTVLVRKIGLKRKNGRTDRQNEVWAGKPVNMAAKLASLSKVGELLCSERYFKSLESNLVLKSCGCPNNESKDLWEKISVIEDTRFDFDYAYKLKSIWCQNHGKDYCKRILELDSK